VELEIQLDELKELYNNVIRNSNSKAQQKKMAFLERNLEQLTLVQKQVGSSMCTLACDLIRVEHAICAAC
jgi:kinesin family member 5